MNHKFTSTNNLGNLCTISHGRLQ